MLTRTFWIGESGVFVRAMRTFAQTALAALGVGQTNLFSADIKNILALATSAAILSILMAVDRNSEPTKVLVETPPTEPQQLQSSYSDET
jgi:hypothetical protein